MEQPLPVIIHLLLEVLMFGARKFLEPALMLQVRIHRFLFGHGTYLPDVPVETSRKAEKHGS